MTDLHLTMLEGVKDILNDFVSGEDVEISDVRNAINDVQTVINENTPHKELNEMIYKFSDYFTSGSSGPKGAA
jgi:hypothetical protein